LIFKQSKFNNIPSIDTHHPHVYEGYL